MDYPHNKELYHHGIKGQRWGVRRYQNYDGTRIKDGKTVTKTSENGFVPVMVVPATLAPLAIAAKVAVSIYQVNKRFKERDANSEENRAKAFEQLYQDREIDTIANIPKQTTKTSTEENAKIVNPDYPGKGSTKNCMLCSVAMAMREKGYDVVANKTDRGFYEDDFYPKSFKGAKVETLPKCKNATELAVRLSEYGAGSYGNLGVQWKTGGAHEVFWKVEKTDLGNQVSIYDGQTGKELFADKKYGGLVSNSYMQRVVRLDNVEPTEYVLASLKANTSK